MIIRLKIQLRELNPTLGMALHYNKVQFCNSATVIFYEIDKYANFTLTFKTQCNLVDIAQRQAYEFHFYSQHAFNIAFPAKHAHTFDYINKS